MQKSSKVRHGIVALWSIKVFVAYTHHTDTHTRAQTLFSFLSCPAGSHQTLSVKPPCLFPSVELTVSLLFALTRPALLSFDIGGASQILGLYCFFVSAVRLSCSTLPFKLKPAEWEEAELSDLLPPRALSAFSLYPFCFSPFTSLHLSFIHLQRSKYTSMSLSSLFVLWNFRLYFTVLIWRIIWV